MYSGWPQIPGPLPPKYLIIGLYHQGPNYFKVLPHTHKKKIVLIFQYTR